MSDPTTPSPPGPGGTCMTDDPPPPRAASISGARFSRSNEAARRAERERIAAMTPLERMSLALSLGRQRRALLDDDSPSPRVVREAAESPRAGRTEEDPRS